MFAFVVGPSLLPSTTSSSRSPACSDIANFRSGSTFVSRKCHVDPTVRSSTRVVAERKQKNLVKMGDGSSPPPINLPSGLLLAISSILAIASVGCVFELTSGHPQYGTTITSGVLAISLPSFVFLYYAALKKGQAEADE